MQSQLIKLETSGRVSLFYFCFWVDSLKEFVLFSLAKMEGLVENVSEIVIVTDYCGRSLASDEVYSEKTGVNANK